MNTQHLAYMHHPNCEGTFKRGQGWGEVGIDAGLIFHKTERNNYRPESSVRSLVLKDV